MKQLLARLGTILIFLLIACGMASSSASATTGTKLCVFNQTPCGFDYAVGTELKSSLAAGTKLTKIFGLELECTGSTMSGKSATTGGEMAPVEATLSSLTFSGCNSGCSITVANPGHFVIENVSGTMNATVSWIGFEIIEGCSGSECRFGSEVSKGIFLRGGAEPTLKFEEAVIPKKSGSGITCANSKWTATYAITTPKPLYVSGATSESFSGGGVLCKAAFSPCASLPGSIGPYRSGTAISAQLKSGVSSALEMGFATAKCTGSSMSGEVKDPGTVTEPIVGVLSSWTFSGCNCEVKVLKAGNFGVDWTSGTNGALVLSGVEIFVDCGGKECTLGGVIKEGITLNGGNPATIKVIAAPIPKKSGVSECSVTANWSAEYEVTAPKPLNVEET